ncbi:MAG: HAMP domain-containing histidine kinase [Bdellovibrionales bacterium]|nr:HAMP domain-containing histidine kinase [Bdellovibrionales bacterium]
MEGNRHSTNTKDDHDVKRPAKVPSANNAQIRVFFRRPYGDMRRDVLKLGLTREAREISRADLVISQEDGTLSITDQTSNREIAYLPASNSNLPAIAQILRQFNQTMIELAHNPRPKRFEQISSLLTSIRLYPSVAAQTNNHPTRKSLSTIRDVHQLSLKSSNLEQLLKNILQLKRFKRHDTCQLLIHQKGHHSFISNLYNRHDGLVQTKDQIGDFHSIYNLVKKSKSKYFDQTSLLKDTLGIVGTFLAKEFRLDGHDAILIISRNSFLKDGPEDQSNFELLAQPIARILNRILEREQLERRQNQIRMLLDVYPHPLAVSNEDNEILYHNSQYKGFKSQRLETVELNRDHQLLLQMDNPSTVDSEIYHHHRITLLGELLNTLRHELSNPLFGIQLNSDILITEHCNHPDVDIIMDLAKSCCRCQDIIKGFSDLYRNEKSITHFDLKKIIEQVTTLCKSESREIRKNIVYDSTISDGAFFIKSNPTWITQIVFNLIINSAQAVKTKSQISPSDSIQISCRQLNSKVIIQISDTGPGIENNIQKQIFDPFFTTKPKGTGLGLSICYGLALRLGGGIYFYNNLDTSGATFALILPYEDINN